MAPQLNNDKNKVNTTQKGKGSIDFNHTFWWLSNEFNKSFANASEEFLSTDLNFYLFAATNQPLMFWKSDEYFVTQVELASNSSFTVRLSSIAAQILLENAFGQKDKMKGELRLKDITELEARILTAYNEFLFKKLEQYFIKKEKLKEKSSQPSFKTTPLHLTFYVYDNENPDAEAGKIILSFPEGLLAGLGYVNLPVEPLDILEFSSGSTTADVYVGKSKIALEDLRNIDVEDIIILEKSNIHSMVLRCGEDIKFKVNPDPRLVVDVKDDGGEEAVSETNSNKDIWDSIQVDVSAEFEKIKITLGELKQITEGLVLDIAPIVDNEILLHVEGKQVAYGELVIIGDRYGVKITKVCKEAKEEQEEAVQQAAEEQDPPVTEAETEEEQTEENTDDDFDYSDFEIDDDI